MKNAHENQSEELVRLENFLREHSLFGYIPEKTTRVNILARSEIMNFRAQQQLCTEGSPAVNFYILLEGKLELSSGDSGDKFHSGTLQPAF